MDINRIHTGMPTFKNIRIRMKNGKTRMQRVQVLASGKYKFVKNIGSRARKAVKTVKGKRRRKAASKGKTLAKGNSKGKMFRTLGAGGAIEDFVWGFGGLALMGHNNPVALPAIRLVQGLQGHLLDRTGKGRTVYAMIDLLDLILAGATSTTGIFDSLRQLTKIRALIPA